MKKRCSCCGKEKDLTDFCKNKRAKDGYHYCCSECNAIRARRWRNKNPDKIKEYNRAHSTEHSVWAKNNADRLRQVKRNWARRNKEKVLESQKKSTYKRFHSDALFKYKTNCRNIIYQAVHRNTPYSEQTKMFLLLGCSYETLREHLLQTWANRYKSQYNGENFNIDHIVPLHLAEDEDEVRSLCHYSNLQMLTPEDNRTKSDKMFF